MITVKMNKQSLTDGLKDCHLVHFQYKICLITALFWEKNILLVSRRKLKLMICHESWGYKDRKSMGFYKIVWREYSILRCSITIIQIFHLALDSRTLKYGRESYCKSLPLLQSNENINGHYGT